VTTTRKALGRGLDALLPPLPAASISVPSAPPLGKREYFLCPIEEIRPAPDQPRRHFSEEALDQLAATIREHGVVQPLLVRREPGREGFSLIAGERRWRAAQRAGLHEVPVVVRDTTAKESFEVALVENLQRQDLDAIEEALAFQRLADDFGLSHDEIATRVGKDRSTVANATRLLQLSARLRQLVIDGTLSAGHARALLGLGAGDGGAVERAARTVVARGLSVRQTEMLVRRLRKDPGAKKAAATADSPAARDVEARLRARLATKVRLNTKADGSGCIEIDYFSLDELDRILAVVLG
jgi:ParB family transcriptional regulator, chromosome partitioning protein